MKKVIQESYRVIWKELGVTQQNLYDKETVEEARKSAEKVSKHDIVDDVEIFKIVTTAELIE